MSINVQFIYDTPHREIASILNDQYQACTTASMIAGFMTVEGVESIVQSIADGPSKLSTLVVGASTWQAFNAFDRLLGIGVPPNRLRVHLGRTHPTKSAGAQLPFYRYHPMLHSKVYLFQMPDGTASAFVGSHNLTGFALGGLNGEAGVLLKGPSEESVYSDVGKHISAAVADSVQYDPSQREAYAWWAAKFMEGFALQFNDTPQDGQAQRTIVIIAESSGSQLPSSGDVIYFELPAAIGKVTSTTAEVHLFVFDNLPATPSQALLQLDNARASYWCKTIGLEDDQGGKELDARWEVAGPRPILRPVQRPFRPTPGPGMQQVRVRVSKRVYEKFEYLFGEGKASFEPLFDEEGSLSMSPEIRTRVHNPDLLRWQDVPWYKVTGLRQSQERVGKTEQYREALRKLSPEAGSFIMMSMRRRPRAK